MVKALRFYGRMIYPAIASTLNLIVRQVQYAVFGPIKPRYTEAYGRVPIIPEEIREIIRDHINTPRGSKRLLPWKELYSLIPTLEVYSTIAIRTAMEADSAQRIPQPMRQPLTRRVRQLRLEFALKWASLLLSEWEQWI